MSWNNKEKIKTTCTVQYNNEDRTTLFSVVDNLPLDKIR
jgi:hypothetical protein